MGSNLLNPAAGVVALTAQLINIQSVSGDEARIADEIEAVLRDCSWLQVERYRHNVIARTNFGHSQRVVVAGHIDTVPVADNDVARFVDHEDGQRLYGLGACDMKGGVAVALCAAVSIPDPQFDVTYIFYECEEVDSARNGLTHVAAEHPEWLSADIAVLLEPSNAAIEAGCQGTLRARVHTTGVRSHSARSWKGSNAIHKLAPALETLANYQPRVVNIDGLDYREGLNAVAISGGVAGNIIPDVAYVEVNYRYAPSRSGHEAEAHIRETFSGFEVEFVDNAPGAMPGLDRAPLADLLQRVNGVAAPKFGWTDVARFYRLGVPAVNLGPGNPELAHARDEYVPVAQLESCERLVTGWLRGQ